jgi:peptidoglycan-associated lipoprotein
VPDRDPEKDALPLRSDLFKHASTLATALAALAATFLVTGFKDIPSAAGRGFLALSIVSFLISAIAGFSGLSNMAYHVRRGHYGLPFEAKFPLLIIYGSLALGVLFSLISIAIFLTTPTSSKTPTAASTDQTPKKVLKENSPAKPPSSPLKEVYYDYDRYNLRSEALDTLKANAEWLKANPSIKVLIEGHADDRGSNKYNLSLGAKRAQAVKDSLLALGIPAQRLFTISYGNEVPVCVEGTDECRQKNRRARFVTINL